MARVGLAKMIPATPNATPHRTHPPVLEVQEASPSPPGTRWSPSGVHAGEQVQYGRAGFQRRVSGLENQIEQ